jgi:hypothetical protein
MHPAPRLLARAGAVSMPASLFLHWYEVAPGIFRDSGFTVRGWDVFEWTDAVLVLAGIAVLLLVVMNPPYASRGVLMLGALATTSIAIQIVDKPAVLGLFDTPGLSVDIGAWVGLAGAVAIVAAGAASSRTLGRGKRLPGLVQLLMDLPRHLAR